MTDDMFEKFLNDSIKDFGDSYIEDSELSDESHGFSPKFERRMRRLIKKQKRFYFPLVKTPLRLSFTVIAMVILMTVTTVMSVSASRNAVISFIKDTFSMTSGTIEEIYEISYDLTGYKEEHVDFGDRSDHIRETNYTNGYKVILFFQFADSSFNKNASTQAEGREHIDMDGYDVTYYCDAGKYHDLIWNNGDYTFKLWTNLSKEETFDIARSVRKSE